MLNLSLFRATARRFARTVGALDDRFFAECDRAAMVRGWQITRPHLLTRTYRDPRWDQVDLEPIPPSTGALR